MDMEEMGKLIDEINEVADGRRGWVSLTKARAELIGINHWTMLGCAKVYDLKVERHGRMGWCGSRAA